MEKGDNLSTLVKIELALDLDSTMTALLPHDGRNHNSTLLQYAHAQKSYCNYVVA